MTGVLWFALIYVALSTALKLVLIVAARSYLCPAGSVSGARTPVVTIFIPMHKEGEAVGTLTAALERLGYPAAKLDVKYLVEEGDTETWTVRRAHRVESETSP